MLPTLQHFYRQLKKDVNSGRGRDGGIKYKVWRRWLPGACYNVDQVPLPFIVQQDTTYETTGSTSVWVAQPGSGLDKRQCTLQLCIRPSDSQPFPPAIIFRAKGKVKEEKLKSYDPRVHVFWQKNGWMDKEVALQWVEKTFSPAVDKSHENVLFLDNLSCQCSDKFILNCRRKANTVVYPLPPSSTDKVQPIDAGDGRQMKKLIGEQLDEYLEDDENLEAWCGESYSASKRRIMITKWVGTTWSKMSKYRAYRQRLFEKTGLLMTADGSGDKLINPQGYKDYILSTINFICILALKLKIISSVHIHNVLCIILLLLWQGLYILVMRRFIWAVLSHFIQSKEQKLSMCCLQYKQS